jgi:hypothetical protein
MQSDTWIALLHKVPSAYHDSLVLVTSVGLEVSLQTILRMEEQYLVVRGRMAGSNDTGRIFFIPYDQINFLGIQKVLKASEIRLMYGEPPGEAEPDETPTAEASEAAPAEPDKPEPAQKAEPVPAVEAPPKPAPPPRMSKSELLARIRSRSLGASANGAAD